MALPLSDYLLSRLDVLQHVHIASDRNLNCPAGSPDDRAWRGQRACGPARELDRARRALAAGARQASRR